MQPNLFDSDGEIIYHTMYEVDKRSDVQKAKDYLRLWPFKWFTPEEIKNQANLNIGTPALARKLRLARERGIIVSRLRAGKSYIEYTWIV